MRIVFPEGTGCVQGPEDLWCPPVRANVPSQQGSIGSKRLEVASADMQRGTERNTSTVPMCLQHPL